MRARRGVFSIKIADRTPLVRRRESTDRNSQGIYHHMIAAYICMPPVLSYILFTVSEVVLIDGHSVDDTIKIVLQLYSSICITEQIGLDKGDALRIGFGCIVEMLIHERLLAGRGKFRPVIQRQIGYVWADRLLIAHF
jgi:hypothetical protein